MNRNIEKASPACENRFKGPGFSSRSGDRRKFFKDLARMGCTAGLLTGGLILGLRKPGRPCPVQSPCRQCSRLSGCDREEARAFRRQTEAAAEKNHG